MRPHIRHIIGATASLLLVAPCGAITFQEDPAVKVEKPASMPAGQESNGITYVSGGAGTEEREMLEATGSKYNLKLTVAAPDGKLVVPDSLRIVNQGGTELLKTTPNGPLFLATMPPGAYSIIASSGGREVTRAVMVSNQRQEAVTLTMNPQPAAPSAGDAPAVPRPAVPGEPPVVE